MTTGKPSHLVPKLRFPEFRGSAEWHRESLSRLLTFQNGYPFSSSNFREERQGLRLIRNRDLRSEDRVVYYDGRPPSDFIVSNGDLLIGMDGDFTPCMWHKGRGLLNQRVGRILPRGKHVLRFLGYLLEIHLKVVHEDTARTTVKHLSSRTVLGMPIHAPAPDEQQKIADCLGSLDDLIVAEGQKLEALRQHKKGLMQQLFPQPGETQPQLGRRINWKSFDLPDRVFFQEGPGIMAVDFRDDGVPLVRLSGLSEPTVTLDGCNYLSPEKVADKWEHFRLVEGDLLVSASASFGRPAIVTEVAAGAVFYTGLIRFRPLDDCLSAAFLRAYLDSPSFMRQATAFAVGGGIKHFGPSHLRQMQIQVPPDEEQERVADLCSSIDEVLVSQSRRVDALIKHKQGLLQQLFPSLEAESR